MQLEGLYTKNLSLSCCSLQLLPTVKATSLRGVIAGKEDRLRGFDGGLGTKDGCTGALWDVLTDATDPVVLECCLKLRLRSG